jgi:O-antigen/teichoic acid export membrane protein
LWGTLAFVLTVAAQLALTPIYVKYLGFDGFGLLNILISILTPLSMLNLGFGQATIKYVAERCAVGRPDQAGAYVRSTLLFNTGLGVLGAVLIWVGAGWLVAIYKTEPRFVADATVGFRLVGAGWLFTQIGSTFMGVPTALQQFRIVSLWTVVFSTLSASTGLLVLEAGGTFTQLMITRAMWTALAAVVWWRVAAALLPGISFWPSYDRDIFRKSMNFGVWQSMASLGGVLAAQTDTFLLSRYLGESAVGVYRIPSLAYQQVYALVAKLAESLFPAISDMEGQGQAKEATRLVTRGTWLISLAMVSCMGGLFVFAPDVLRLYMHGTLPPVAADVLRLFCVSSMITSATPGLVQYLLGSAQSVWLAGLSLSSGVVTFAASLIMVRKLGLNGAAWGMLAGVMLTRPAIYFAMWRQLFRPAVPFWTLFVALFGCPLIGLVICLGLTALRGRTGWTPGWFQVILLGSATTAFIGAATAWICTRLPGGADRRRDLTTILGIVARRRR